MSLFPETCPFCGAGVRAVKDGDQRWVEFECFSEIGEKSGEFRYRSPICRHAELNAAKDRVAELEAQNAQLQSELDHTKARAKELQAETLRLEDLAKHRGKLMTQAVDQSRDLEDRVAELEARTHEAEESNANALASLSAAEARIELRRVENEAVRRQLGHAENACDAMEKRVAELEARCKRLEEAGDALLGGVPASFQGAWRAAKEAKP